MMTLAEAYEQVNPVTPPDTAVFFNISYDYHSAWPAGSGSRQAPQAQFALSLVGKNSLAQSWRGNSLKEVVEQYLTTLRHPAATVAEVETLVAEAGAAAVVDNFERADEGAPPSTQWGAGIDLPEPAPEPAPEDPECPYILKY